MALTKTQVSELYVAIFNRASEGNGNTFWQTSDDAATAATAMLATPDAQSYFGSSLDSDQAFIEHIYLNTLNKTNADDAAGITFWVDLLTGGQSRGEVVTGIIEAAQDPVNAGAAQDQFNNRVAVSDYTADTLAGVPADYATSLAFDGALVVTDDAATVTAAEAAVDAIDEPVDPVDPGVEGSKFYLTIDQDILTGTDDNDTFIARGNSSLDNADIIDGGAGRDTVEVMLDNDETAESPLFTNIEVLKVQAQEVAGNDGENDASGFNVNIDAGDMESVEEYWSEDSRSHVTIEDVSRNSHITTVGFRESDPGAAVDLNVFFDPQNITAKGEAETGSTLTVKVANVLNIAEDTNPLDGFSILTFDVDGETVTVSFSGLTSYAALVTAIDDALDAAGISGVAVAEGADADAFFSIDIDAFTAGTLAGQYTPIVLTSNSAVLTQGTFVLDDTAPDGNLVQTQTNEVAAPVPALTSVEVILDRVGKNSDGGDLLIGSDSTGPSGSAGIQQFNIDVDRDSSVRTISSTNNTLEVINVENISDNSDGTGDLSISGDGEDAGITDVRVFDASTMVGDVTLVAELTDAVVGKYLELTDEADPSADNSQTQAYRDVVDTEFSYDLGAGDDSLDLDLPGKGASTTGNGTREDFVLEINAGAGDDTVTTDIGLMTANEYANQKAMAALTVNTDSGNDTVNSAGQGDWVINTGSGNDTVYANNDGGKGIWVIAGAASLTDMVATGSADSAFLLGSTITVTLSGAALALAGAGVIAGAAVPTTNGFESTVTVDTVNGVGTQYSINQAIKEAINSDAVLSKLLVATDGAADTLVITSLVDGEMGQTDLDIDLTALDFTTLTGSALTTAQSNFETFMNDSTDTLDQAALNAGQDVYATSAGAIATGNLDDLLITATVGSNSATESDNTINLGADNDVAVLGTDVDSNDTLVFSGSFGTDTIFNFEDAATTAQDALDFTAYLGGLETLPGSTSTVSQTVVATGATVTATVAANTVVDTNEVIVITDFTATLTDTWAGLTGSTLLAAIVDTNVGASNYGDITATTLDVNETNGRLVGTTLNTVVMIENEQNLGEYKVFSLTSTDATTAGAEGEFTAATLVGTVDFGNSIAVDMFV